MEQVRRLLNPEALRELNCARDVKFPVSYSLQSVDLPPAEENPGISALTFRRPGEIRIVHGNEDVHAAVKRAVEKNFPVAAGEAAEKAAEEGAAEGKAKNAENEAAPNNAEPEKVGVKTLRFKKQGEIQERDWLQVSREGATCSLFTLK